MPSYLHTTSDSTQEPCNFTYKLAYKNEIEISISDIFGFMTNQELLYHKLRETDPHLRRLISQEIETRGKEFKVSSKGRRLNSMDFIRYILKNREENYWQRNITMEFDLARELNDQIWDDFMNYPLNPTSNTEPVIVDEVEPPRRYDYY